MKCHICDEDLDDPTIDPRDGKFMPCSKCLDEVYDALTEFGDDEEGESDESVPW